jgi:probable F420-dependent oxidoreductase
VDFWHSSIFLRPDEAVELAVLAESLGFAGTMVADHIAYPVQSDFEEHPQARFEPVRPYPDPIALLAAMATATRTLRLVTYSIILPMRDPFTVAKAFATLSLLSGNRVGLGVAAGWMAEEFEVLGKNFHDRGARLDEGLAAIRRLWEPGPTSFEGKYYSFPPVVFDPVPDVRPPIYIGGHSDVALRRAAAADGWLGLQFPRDELEAIMSTLDNERRALGRADEAFETIVLHDEPNEPVSLDLIHWLEDIGVRGLLLVPLPMTVGEESTLADKAAAMESFAEEFIGR